MFNWIYQYSGTFNQNFLLELYQLEDFLESSELLTIIVCIIKYNCVGGWCSELCIHTYGVSLYLWVFIMLSVNMPPAFPMPCWRQKMPSMWWALA